MSSPKPWRELASELLLDCRIFSVERLLAASPENGDPHTFFRIRSCDWAQIVPVTPEGEIVMIRQFRHGAGAVTLEIPGGLVEDGEAPAVTAARECLEETGYAVDRVEPLCVVNPNPALFNNRLYAFYALDAHPAGEIQNDGVEHTERVLVPVQEVAELLTSGAIDHALVAATLWRFLHGYRSRP